ncbi:Alpha/Beta hydrolase protein [Nemania sp. NC0429]|nr:Alpha/Beta hydrolase protein [Nemania sp. NC0429]
MASPDQESYLREPLNPYRADYDNGLQMWSESETWSRYIREKNRIIKRADWRSQRNGRDTEIPPDRDIQEQYGLLRDTRRIPRDVSCRGHDYQILVDNKVITEDVNVVVVYQKTVREAEPGTLPCIFYIHGGCRYGGTPYSGYLERAKQWATYFNAIAVSVEYRLSPNQSDESPTGEEPTNDCFDALTWVYHQLGANEDSILKYASRTKMIVFGTSAGGGLAASTVIKWCQEQREGTGRAPGGLHGLILEAPQLDDRCNTQSQEKFKYGNMFTSGDALRGWDASLGIRRGTEQVSVFEAPARASEADVQGLPPTYIDVGAAEPFRDEALAFSNTLRSAKVDVEMNVWDGGFHGFFTAEPNALVSRLCELTKLKWLGRRLGIQNEHIDNEYEEVKKAYDSRGKEARGLTA